MIIFLLENQQLISQDYILVITQQPRRESHDLPISSGDPQRNNLEITCLIY